MGNRREITSMGRARFEELRDGILDGTLAQRWRALEGKDPDELTRKQRVELRQLSWIVCLCESNHEALRDIVADKQWRKLKVFDYGDGTAVTKAYL